MQKLQPFFPPLEPLQSRNLRIALHRSLDGLKKDGVLGREIALRKTMLDECKGEKLYEVLASFSQIVLKKALASHSPQSTDTAVARTLAISASLSDRQQASMLPLAIAHRAALVNVLRRKEEKRARYAEFGRLLDAKAEEINKRIRKTIDTPRASKPAVPQREADLIKKQLKDNWIGDQKWVDVMLHGDDVEGDAVFLNGSFTKVWRMVDQGRRLEDAVPDVGLLEKLQLRVDEQRTRLEKWKEFHKKMQGEGTASDTSPKLSAPSKELRFDDHLQFQLRSKTSAVEPAQRRELPPAYHEIVLDMEDELAQASSARYTQSTIASSTHGRRASYAPAQHHISRSQSDSIPKLVSSLPKTSKPIASSRVKSDDILSTRPTLLARPSTGTPLDSEATLVGQTSTVRTTISVSPAIESPTEQLPQSLSNEDASDAPEELTTCETSSPPSSPPPPSSYYPSEPPVLQPPTLSTEEALATQIVSTIGDATPSPAKKLQPRLSLLERTRMSMVRTASFPPITESPSLPELPSAIAEDRHAALMERTRLSMAAMSAKPRASLAPTEKKKPARQSQVFPVNQFDTPRGRKSDFLVVEEGETQKTPKEDLFSDDVDYDRVFRSRPRIATSPVFGTPAVDMGTNGEDDDEFDEGVTGVDLAGVDEEDDGEMFEQESPSRRAWR